MTGMSTLSATNLLQYVTGYAAMPALATPGHVFPALFTSVGTDAGSGFGEISTTSTGYARPNLTGSSAFNAATGAIPNVISNATNISFGTATADWGTVIAWGIYDAVTNGNLLWWDFLGADPWFPFTGTLASPGVFTAIGITAGSSPTLANNAWVVFSAEYGGALPAAVTQYTPYQVSSLSADTFTLNAGAVNTASTSAGMVRQITKQVISAGVAVSLTGGTPGNLVLTAA